MIASLALAGAVRDRRKLLAALVVFYLLQIGHTVIHPRYENGLASGWSLVMVFLAGITLYRYRDRIPWNWKLFLLSLALALVLIAAPNGDRFEALPLAYLTVYLGLLNPPRQRWLLSGDYSYGLFLYGYPIQQACVAFGFARGHWYLNLAAAIPLAFVVAAISWWLVEKPALKSRVVLKRIESRISRALCQGTGTGGPCGGNGGSGRLIRSATVRQSAKLTLAAARRPGRFSCYGAHGTHSTKQRGTENGNDSRLCRATCLPPAGSFGRRPPLDRHGRRRSPAPLRASHHGAACERPVLGWLADVQPRL